MSNFELQQSATKLVKVLEHVLCGGEVETPKSSWDG